MSNATFTTAGNNERVTIYWMSDIGMGIKRIEGKLVEFGRSKYAQYERAPFVVFIPKGKRNAVKIIQTYEPFLVIIRGSGPDPRSPWGEEKDCGSVQIRQMRHGGCSSEWRREGDELIASVDSGRIVFDGRNGA